MPIEISTTKKSEKASFHETDNDSISSGMPVGIILPIGNMCKNFLAFFKDPKIMRVYLRLLREEKEQSKRKKEK